VTSGTPPPAIWATIARAFRDALPLMRSGPTAYVALAVLSLLVGLYIPFSHGPGRDPFAADSTFTVRLQLAFRTHNILSSLAAPFVVFPSVARTADPAFRFTAAKLFGFIGVTIVVSVAAGSGFLLFVLSIFYLGARFSHAPWAYILFLLVAVGAYVGVKFSQAPWAFVLSEGKNPFAESWELTKGMFWRTLGFSLVLVFAAIPPTLGSFVLMLPIIVLPTLAFALLPVAVLLYMYAYNATFLGQVRWMLALRASAVRA
jgi:hypothetical protein